MDAQFFDSPGNPRPANAVAGWFTASDGIRLRYARAPVTGRPHKGTVVILPGRGECIEKYFETMRDLAARGLGSAILDWRGQGASDRLLRDVSRGHVARFDDYVSDLDQFFSDIVLPDCRGPHFLLGHSTGALIALLAGPMLSNRVSRMVLVAPFLEVTGMPLSMRGVKRFATALRLLGLGNAFAYGAKPELDPPFATNKVTTDPDRYRRNRLILETHPHLALSGPTVSWVYAACMASATVQTADFVRRITVPTLIAAAGADEVVSTRAIEAFSRTMKSASLLTIDGARHEILQEADAYREPLLAAFDAFVPGKALPEAAEA